MIIKGNNVGYPLPDPSKGLEMQGGINMNGQPISGLNAPTANDQAANMGFVNQQVKKAAPRNLLVNSGFRNPVNQRGQTVYTDANATIDRWGIAADGAGAYCAITVNNGSVKLNSSDGGLCYLYQRFPAGVLSENKHYTIAVGFADGSIQIQHTGITHNADFSQIVINIQNNSTLLWAALYEGEYTVETLPEYRAKGYMVEALNCGALTVHKTLTLSANGWSSSTPYTQTIAVEGILGTDTPHYSVVYSTNTETALAQKEAFAMVDDLDTSNGSVKFTCFEEKPEVNLTILLEVNR